MLRCHRTQKEWLDVTQGPDVYLKGIDESSGMCAKFSGKFTAAEGWIQHNHMGFCGSKRIVSAIPDTEQKEF